MNCRTTCLTPVCVSRSLFFATVNRLQGYSAPALANTVISVLSQMGEGRVSALLASFALHSGEDRKGLHLVFYTSRVTEVCSPSVSPALDPWLGCSAGIFAGASSTRSASLVSAVLRTSSSSLSSSPTSGAALRSSLMELCRPFREKSQILYECCVWQAVVPVAFWAYARPSRRSFTLRWTYARQRWSGLH